MSISEETCDVYCRDVTSLPGLVDQIISKRFDVVAQPVSVWSLQRLVRYALENEIPMVPRGHGTSGWGGAIPSRGGICVSLTQMIRIIKVDEYESFVTVESGITWRDLLMFLERMGTTLPVYPSSAVAATVGGFVASGGIGIGSARYGDIRTQVLGLEAVLANGRIVRIGRFVLDTEKDVFEDEANSGTNWFLEQLGDQDAEEVLDSMQVLMATYGTIGMITKVTLRTIPKLQLRPFVCSFDSMSDLVEAARRIMSDTRPYHIRYMADNYTAKLDSLANLDSEYGKFILSGALLSTVYENDEDYTTIEKTTKDVGGLVLDGERAEFHWSERFFPLRVKRKGPSLVPAEVLVPIDQLPQMLEEIEEKLKGSEIAVEGTLGAKGEASCLVWILDDERQKLSFTVGWYRSFEINSLAGRYGGHTYAVALWNTRQAKEFYGERGFQVLQRFKRRVDPKDLLNPMKVFGGRIEAAWQSLAFGFGAGFISALLISTLGPSLLGLTWAIDLMSMNLFPLIPIPTFVIVSLLGGVFGLLFIKLLSLNWALTIGIPLLKLLSKFLRK
ncbi:MAG: FAD-binding oxidoreductase [Candidatus Thorarchaeota archaeon]